MSIIDFAPFQLDLAAWQLRRGGETIPLRRKTFAVLRYLAERPGELVTKEALLDAVWPDVEVLGDVVRQSVGELREAFGDDRSAPRFIETVPRLGYRFIAKVRRRDGDRARPAPAASVVGSVLPEAEGIVVGRRRELGEIAQWAREAMMGRRQVVFATGEAGIGKTTLVGMALAEVEDAYAREHAPAGAHRPSLRVARGQCVEQYGGGEPFKPIVEALGALCRGEDRVATEDVLRSAAPAWLLQALRVAEPKPHAEERELAAVGREHSLQMLATSITALAADDPLVLVFEDVHWSDHSTLDLLTVLAQGREPARLLVLCTLRAADAIARAHPLVTVKRELLRKRQCREVQLGGLSAAEVATYLERRFPGAALPAEALPLLVDRSDGNPFFLVTLVDHLLELGTLVAGPGRLELRGSPDALRTAIPDGLRAIVEPRLERLTADELAALQAASVAGLEFPAHAVAGLVRVDGELADVEAVEALCDRLVHRQDILRANGESSWPDGTTSARYAFRHALYQQVLHHQLAPTLRRRLHQTVGERLEAGFTGRTEEIATRLAAHFEQSRDVERAVRYHGEAAARARSRLAFEETRLHVEAALRLMRDQPETDEVLGRQVPLLNDLGWSSYAHKGWGDEGAARAFARMREIAERLDVSVQRYRAMYGELTVHAMRAEYAAARRLGEEMLQLAEQIGDRPAVVSLMPLGATLLHLGELEAACEIGERVRAWCDPNEPTMDSISCRNLLASPYAHLGFVARAREANGEAIALAARSDVPFLRAVAAAYSAAVDLALRDPTSARPRAAEAARIAGEHDFPVLHCLGRLFLGWCDVQEGRAREAIDGLHAAFDEHVALGQRTSTSSHSLPLVEAHLAVGDLAGASAALDFALAFVDETGEKLMEHELHRLRGECLLAGAATHRGRSRERARAIECFERAIALAEGQKALLFELRAATSLHRARPDAARDRLARLVARFGPRDDCADLRAARAALGA